MDFFSFLAGTQNEVAEFYAGMIQSTFEIDIRKDLQACMVDDKDLAKLWDQTIDEIWNGQEVWEKHFELALDLSPHDMTACAKLPKVAIAGKQLQMWWETFWAQEDADNICDSNYSKNYNKSNANIVAVRFDWELGYYYDAGKRFGKFWNVLMGKPQWEFDDQLEQVAFDAVPADTSYFNGNTMAIFQGKALAYLFNEDLTEQLETCLVYDPIEVEMTGTMIGALDSYDTDESAKFTFDKYLMAIETLDKFNWYPCMANDAIKTLAEKDGKWSMDFWSQKDAEQQFEANYIENMDAVDQAALAVQTNWASEDFATAGENWGKMWALLMGGKPINEESVVYGWSD